MTQRKSTKYQIRLPLDLYTTAREKADQEDIALAQVLRRFLRRWTAGDLPTSELFEEEKGRKSRDATRT